MSTVSWKTIDEILIEMKLRQKKVLTVQILLSNEMKHTCVF